MAGTDIEIAADGGAFESYLSLPADGGPSPGVVFASAVFGVNADVRAMADDLAGQGFVVSAPDLFWRGDAGPLEQTEDGQKRARARSRPRVKLIEQGVADIAAAAADLRARAECNGKLGVIGFCYGGPYAVIGPARLGFDAGISFHGTQVEAWADEIAGLDAPLAFHWGTEDHAAPPHVRTLFEGIAAERANVELFVYAGVGHGYTAQGAAAWDADASAKSWAQAVRLLNQLR